MSYNLDTVSTTGSFKTQKPLGFNGGTTPPQPNQKADLLKFGKLWFKRLQNKDQVKKLLTDAKNETNEDTRRKLLRSASCLKFCNETSLVVSTKTGTKTIATFNCGKKYCAICASKKRNKLLLRYLNFFESDKGKKLLQNYDLAMFTVTLQHNKKDLRTEPYYKELSKHWRNAIKYGSFNKYLKGGFYNTEHTYTENGHHIHRHALVLIPKEYGISEGKRDENKKTEMSKLIETELKSQWLSRTDGSFQIDLTPFHKTKIVDGIEVELTLKQNLLEVTKYITKRGKGNIINSEIIKAVDDNNRDKFYNKFGILYNVKELNLNDAKEMDNELTELMEGNKIERMLRDLKENEGAYKIYSVSGLTCKTKKEDKKKIVKSFKFKVQSEVYFNSDLLEDFRRDINTRWWRWYIEQNERMRNKFFAKEWREAKEFKKRWEAKTVWRDAKQSKIDFLQN